MFGFSKKEDKKKTSCCCGNVSEETMQRAEQYKNGKGVKVLGSGCAKCHALQENTEAALKELGRDIPVEPITDFSVIAAYGVMSTPALVINEKVVSYGKVLKKDEVLNLLKENL
jgi:small redox-active disulfide protein 2